MRGPRTTAARKAVTDRVAKTEAIMAAIVYGLERGSRTYQKVNDKAIAIKVELQEAGFTIVRKPITATMTEAEQTYYNLNKDGAK